MNPKLTRSQHLLPFDQLSPADFERLCLWLVRREGYSEARHIGAGGQDGGSDLRAPSRSGDVLFQCKRVKRFGPTAASKAVSKMVAEADPPPTKLLLLVACNVTDRTEKSAKAAAGGIHVEIWALSELDERVKRHAAVLSEFFDLATSDGWARLKRLDQDAREAVRTEIGLHPEHTGLHLERIKAATALREMIDEGPNTLVYGESGVGKSALVLGELAKIEAQPDKLQMFFLNLRRLPESIQGFRDAIGCAFEDVLSKMSASVRLLVVDSAEYVSESRPDLLDHLTCAAKKCNVGVWVICTTESRGAVRAVVETTLASLMEHELLSLTDEDLEEVVAVFPQLRRLITDPRSKELLRRPIIVDLLVRAGPSDYPLSEAHALGIVWGKLVRSDGRTDRGTPDSREQIFRRLARHQLQPGSASDLYDQLDPVALDGLRRDGLLRTPTAAPWQVLPEFSHELLRNYAVCQVLLAEGEPVTALLEMGVPRWALPAARLAAQVLFATPVNKRMPKTGQLKRIQEDFDRLAAAGHGQRWSDLPTEALLPLPIAGTAFSDAWEQLLDSNAYGLRRVLRLIEQSHRHAGLVSPTIAEPVIALILDHGWPRNLRDEIERLLRDWLGALVVANTPADHALRLKLRQRIMGRVKKEEEHLAEQEAKHAAELAARTPEQVLEDERREREFRQFAFFGDPEMGRRAELPRELVRESTLEKLSLLGPDIGEEAEDLLRRVAQDAPHRLAPALEELFTGRSLASYNPTLLTELVETYYLDDRGWGGLRDGIRSHQSRSVSIGPLAAYYRGPFLAMFHADFRNGVACLNRLLNHAAKVRAEVLQGRSSNEHELPEDPEYRITLSITGEPRTYFGDSHVWRWYRGTGVGPYPCMSALQALEFVCDQIISDGVPPTQLPPLLLDGCENLAMPGLVVGILVRHLDKAGEALDSFLVEPAIWRLEFERFMGEHSPFAASSEGIHAQDRRKWNLREAVMALVLWAEGERVDALRQLGQRLVARARVLEEDTKNSEGDIENPLLSVGLATVKGWATTFDRGSYEFTAQEDGVIIQQTVPKDVQRVLEPGNQETTRFSQAMGLVLRYAKRRYSSPGPPDVSGAELQADLMTARELIEAPLARSHRPIDAPAGVAAGALQSSFIKGELLADEDLSWSAQLLAEVAKFFFMNPEQGDETFSMYGWGADRSAACALPFLLLPCSHELRTKLIASDITATDLLDGARWLVSSAPYEVRFFYAQAMDLTWKAPCDSAKSADGSARWSRSWLRRPKCHHEDAIELLDESARGCVLGTWDAKSQRSKIERLEGPLEQALGEVADDKIIVPHLTAAIRALGAAANTPNCCTGRAAVMLAALLDAHQRGMAGREQTYQHSRNDTLVVARVLLVEVANGKEGLLWASVERYARNDELLGDLLLALAAAGEENETAATAARQIWPDLIDQVLDLVEVKYRTRGRLFIASETLASLMPRPSHESAYLWREFEAEPIGWTDVLAWNRQVARWLPVAAGNPRCVDSLVCLLGSLAESDQVTVGLPWIEVLVAGGPERVASSSWHLPEWLHKVQSDAQKTEHLSVWQRIVDMLFVAGDSRVADLSD